MSEKEAEGGGGAEHYAPPPPHHPTVFWNMELSGAFSQQLHCAIGGKAARVSDLTISLLSGRRATVQRSRLAFF